MSCQVRSRPSPDFHGGANYRFQRFIIISWCSSNQVRQPTVVLQRLYHGSQRGTPEARLLPRDAGLLLPRFANVFFVLVSRTMSPNRIGQCEIPKIPLAAIYALLVKTTTFGEGEKRTRSS